MTAYDGCDWEPFCLVHGDHCERTGADCVKPATAHPRCDGTWSLGIDLPRLCLVTVSRTCPTCAGSGEVGTGQDYWGNWETARCRECQGHGEVDALLWEATHCEHDVHHEDDCHLCRAALPAPGLNPWATGLVPVRGGWDSEPPF